jgi:26S proteasome regulatory subunit N11
MFGLPNIGGVQRSPRHCDTSEKIRVSGIALLKMLKHARNGIPLEVIGVMLGSRIDEFTIEVVDVYATPQVATGQTVETTDERFQVKMAALLEQIGYNDVMVGWYHSHPGFDVWFSDVDASNQDAMEQQDQRAVGIVVDPVLSVRGKVVIGAFRNVPGWKEKRLAAGKVCRERKRHLSVKRCSHRRQHDTKVSIWAIICCRLYITSTTMRREC